MGCKKCAEEVCGCSTMNAEEPAVQEPDWIPDGDGRAIGQQDFAINLSPLHAESSNPYVKDWLFLGVKEAKDNEDARNLNCTHCNPKGDNKNRDRVVELRAMKPTSMKLKGGKIAHFKRGDHITLGMGCAQNKLTFNTDTVGTPSPTFNAEESWGFVVVDGKGLRTDAFRTKEQARFYAQKSRDEAGRKGLRVVKAKKSDDRMNKAQMDIIFGKGWDAETFEAFVMPSKEEYMKTLTKRDKEGHPTTLVIAIDTSGSTSFDYKDRKGRKPYPLLEKYKTMAKQMEKTMGATETIILDWNGRGIKRVTDVDSLRSHNGLFSMEGLKKWLDDELGTIDSYTTVLITDMPLHQFKGAETTGSPSPTFNEDITGQDGPSATPTNSNFSAETQTFEAMRTLAPSTRDVDSARRQLKNSGYGEVIYDRYIVNQQGSSNKFYYTAITEKDGKYYPMGAYGRIGYLGTLFNVAGKKERPMAHFGSMEEAYRQIRGKEVSKINARKPEKRYVDYTLTRDAESLSEIEGPTAEATTGGLHSPSSFAMTWEDGSGQSSASIPPNEIAWAETSGIPTWVKYGAGIALLLAGGSFLKAKMSEQKAADNLVNAINKRKGCCGSSKTVRKDSEFSVGQINPVEVEGQNDVYGAEELHSPQTSANVSQPNWGPQTTYLQNQRSTQKMW